MIAVYLGLFVLVVLHLQVLMMVSSLERDLGSLDALASEILRRRGGAQ